MLFLFNKIYFMRFVHYVNDSFKPCFSITRMNKLAVMKRMNEHNPEKMLVNCDNITYIYSNLIFNRFKISIFIMSFFAFVLGKCFLVDGSGLSDSSHYFISHNDFNRHWKYQRHHDCYLQLSYSILVARKAVFNSNFEKQEGMELANEEVRDVKRSGFISYLLAINDIATKHLREK